MKPNRFALISRVAAIVLGLTFLAAGQPALGQKAGKKPKGGQAAPVVVSAIRSVRQAPKGEYTGLIQPAHKALLSTDVAGRLVRLLKKAGDPVNAGEVVAVLENPTMEQDLAVLQAKLQETEAQLVLREQQQSRVASLYRKKLTSAQKFEDGKAGLGVVKAKLNLDRVQVERLRDQLERMVIRSPISGQVITADLEIGQWITPNKPIFQIYNYRQFEVIVGVPSRFLGSVPDSGAVEVNVPEIGQRLKGRIRSVVRHVERSTGNFTLRVEISNPSGLPMSGMLAKVRLPLGSKGTLLTVPRDAIVRRGKRTHLVLVVNNKAKILPVSVGGNLGDDVIVRGKGLKAGLKVVIRGNERLFPGMPVQMAEQSPSLSGGGKL